jgi:hypothetical protein
MKKFNELLIQTKRQANLLEVRNKEVTDLKMQLSQIQIKLNDRERVHQQNRDLVTKSCALQSTIDQLKK